MSGISIRTVFIMVLCGSVSSQAVYQKHDTICFNSIDEIAQKILQEVRKELHTYIGEIRKSHMNEISNIYHKMDILNSTLSIAMDDVQNRFIDHTVLQQNLMSTVNELKGFQNNTENALNQISESYRVIQDDVAQLNHSLIHETTDIDTELQEARNAIENLDSDAQLKHQNISNDLKDIRDRLTNFGFFHTDVTTSLRNIDLLQNKTDNEVKELANTYKRIDTYIRAINQSLEQEANNLKSLIQENENVVETVNLKMEQHLASINDTLTEVQYKDEVIELRMTNHKKEVDDIKETIKLISGNYTLIESGLSSLPSMKLQIVGLTNAKNRLDKQVSNFGSLSGRITTAQNKANSAFNFAKGIGLRCSWTGYVNNFDQVVNYIAPAGYTIRGLYSYHYNGAEDRRFRFYVCR